jgi:acyl-CoA-binding protein
MSDLESRFETAVEEVRHLPQRPENEVLLELYAHFKQATEGDASGKRPGIASFVKRAKFDAWKGLEGTAREDAMRSYIERVQTLQSEQAGG